MQSWRRQRKRWTQHSGKKNQIRWRSEYDGTSLVDQSKKIFHALKHKMLDSTSAAITLHPERLSIALKVSRHIPVTPAPPALTPRITLAFCNEPLYIRMKMKYQYTILGRISGVHMLPIWPGYPFLSSSIYTETVFSLYKTSWEKGICLNQINVKIYMAGGGWQTCYN